MRFQIDIIAFNELCLRHNAFMDVVSSFLIMVKNYSEVVRSFSAVVRNFLGAKLTENTFSFNNLMPFAGKSRINDRIFDLFSSKLYLFKSRADQARKNGATCIQCPNF